MVTTRSSTVTERVISEVQRLSVAGLDATELLSRTARALHRAVPFDLYSAATIDPASNLITQAFGGLPGTEYQRQPANVVYFDNFYFQEGLGYTTALLQQRRWAATLTDLTDGRLDLSLCFRDSLKPAGLSDKLHAIFVDRVLWGDVELYRGIDSPAFEPEQIDLVRRISPLVGAGLKTAALRDRAAQPSAAGEDVPGVIVIDQSRRVVSATPAAERLLGELDPLAGGWRTGAALPVAIQVVLGMLEQSLNPVASERSFQVPRVQVQGWTGRWLTLHASLTEPAFGRPAEWVVVIGASRSEDLAWLTLVSYGLSPREEEVVKLVIGGLSTKQISDRLFIAEHTVQRHLSNIFEKVGVRSRRALVKELFFDQMLPAM
jgi:DNA-binding CsgD family transcriptional regulator